MGVKTEVNGELKRELSTDVLDDSGAIKEQAN
jgi:hypothetical protein